MHKALQEKRNAVIHKLAMSTMSKHQLAFMMWRSWVKKQLHEEGLMKTMINRMMRKAGMMQYNLFVRWKMDTFNDVAKRRELFKNKRLTAMMETLDHRHRNHMKAGYSKLAGESMNTAARQRMIGRLANACFGRL
jgi:hypothetical protein